MCGIPEITIEGQPADWQKIISKANALRKYNLGWWIDEIEPLLKQFLNASQGHINKVFWQNMFKYHSQKKYGSPKIIDGWIIKFFPYNKQGKRNNLTQLAGFDSLPNEIVTTDVDYFENSDKGNRKLVLELWAGFMGVKQNNTTLGLTPKIGWMIRIKDTASLAIKEKLYIDTADELGIRVRTIPQAILDLPQIRKLEIYFTDSIKIPDAIAQIRIGKFEMHGKIDDYEIARVCRLLPNTWLRINEVSYNVDPSRKNPLNDRLDYLNVHIISVQPANLQKNH